MNKEELKTGLKDVVQEEFNEQNIGYWVGQSIVDKQLDLIDQLDEPDSLTEDWIRRHSGWVTLANGEKMSVVSTKALREAVVGEPEKPVVPKWVAEILEDDEISRPMAKLNMVIHNQVNEPESGETCNRTIEFLTERGMHLDDFICKVMFTISTNFYEVEKESLFHMPVPYLEDAYYRNDNLKMLTSFKKDSKFTQAELDERFPDIKHMAEEVGDE